MNKTHKVADHKVKIQGPFQPGKAIENPNTLDVVYYLVEHLKSAHDINIYNYIWNTTNGIEVDLQSWKLVTAQNETSVWIWTSTNLSLKFR